MLFSYLFILLLYGVNLNRNLRNFNRINVYREKSFNIGI